MGKLSREKGKAWEREVARRLRAVMPGVEIKRGLQARGGGKEHSDVVNPIFHVECKHEKEPRVWQAIAQAERDATESGEAKMPVAVVKRNRQRPVAIMPLDDFLDLVGEWWELGRR